MEGMDTYRILELVLTSLLGIATIVFGVKFKNLREKFVQILDLMGDVNKSLEDNTLTQDEMKHIVADVMKILGREQPAQLPSGVTSAEKGGAK